MPYDEYPGPSKKPERAIDRIVQRTSDWLQSTRLIRKTKIKTWQACLVAFFVIGLTVATAATVYFKIQSQSRAAVASTLSLTPATATVTVGAPITLDVMLDTQTNVVVAAKAVITYDPALFSLQSWSTANSAFTNTECVYNSKPCEIVNDDPTNGKITITLAKPLPGVNTASGLIAKLTFQTLQATAPTSPNIRFEYVAAGSFADSDVVLADGTEALNAVSGSQVTVTAASDGTPPSTPGTPVASNITATGLTLNWTASTDNVSVTGYRVERCQGSGCAIFAQIATPSGTSYIDTGLTANTTYLYRVRASDAAGNLSSYSGTVSATTQAPPDTTPPTILLTAPAPNTTVNGTVTMTATASDNVAVTNVEFLVDGGVKGSDTTAPYSFDWDTTNGGTHACAGAHTHTLTTKASDAAGNVTTSSTVTVNMNNPSYCNPPDTTPPLISSISVSGITQSGATISWTTNEAADTQVEYGQTASYGQSTTLNTSLVTSHSQTLSSLTPSTTYHYRVKSKDAAGNLATSGDQTFTITDTTAPTAPTSLVATPANPTQINLTWTASTDNVGVTGYRVERCQGTSCTNFAQIATPTINSYSNTGLTASTPYTYRIRGVDAAGNLSSYSATVSAITLTLPDTQSPTVALTAPAPNATLSGTVTLSATATDPTVAGQVTSGIAGVQFQLDGINLGSEDTTAPYAFNWNTTLVPNAAYLLTVKGRDAAGNIATSLPITVTVNNDTTPPAITILAPLATLPAGTTSTPMTVVTTETASCRYAESALSFGAMADAFQTTDNLTHSITLSGLTDGLTRVYYVRCQDTAGNVNATATLVTVRVALPDVPVDTTPPVLSNLVSSGTGNHIAITWGTDELSDSKVNYGRSQTALTSTISSGTLVTSHSLALVGLKRRTTYYYQASSKDAAGNLATSTPSSFKTGNGKTAPLTQLQAAQGSVKLFWVASDDEFVTKIEIYRSTTGYPTNADRSALITTLTDPVQTTYADTTVENGTTYYYSLYAVDDLDIVSDPATILFTPQAPLPTPIPGPTPTPDKDDKDKDKGHNKKKSDKKKSISGKVTVRPGERLAPRITLAAPRVGLTVGKSISLQGNATDRSGIQAMIVTVNGTKKKRMNGNTLNYTYTHKNLAKKVTTIEINAYDAFGNRKLTRIVIDRGRVASIRYY